MWFLPLAALLLAAPAPDSACIQQVRDTCLQAPSACPRPVDLAPGDRSCLSCGVTWLKGELADDALAALVTAVRKATKNPIMVIEAWADRGKQTARVKVVASCAPGRAAGDVLLFLRKGPRWTLKSRTSWVE